ncbi:hypothetical protein AVEN_203553-1 [Araneus ventricosus]|uniref:TIL domain-containing protein n=1 Tax=Araneus ventricosus TaxID=182803 RepID=A0A4Y2A7N5_ARAVE|nr:hypothetical protein AVEN_203553-1 [Araneus ventricosus]
MRKLFHILSVLVLLYVHGGLQAEFCLQDQKVAGSTLDLNPIPSEKGPSCMPSCRIRHLPFGVDCEFGECYEGSGVVLESCSRFRMTKINLNSPLCSFKSGTLTP